MLTVSMLVAALAAAQPTASPNKQLSNSGYCSWNDCDGKRLPPGNWCDKAAANCEGAKPSCGGKWCPNTPASDKPQKDQGREKKGVVNLMRNRTEDDKKMKPTPTRNHTKDRNVKN